MIIKCDKCNTELGQYFNLPSIIDCTECGNSQQNWQLEKYEPTKYSIPSKRKKKKVVSKKSQAPDKELNKCPKCGGFMVDRVCIGINILGVSKKSCGFKL